MYLIFLNFTFLLLDLKINVKSDCKLLEYTAISGEHAAEIMEF